MFAELRSFRPKVFSSKSVRLIVKSFLEANKSAAILSAGETSAQRSNASRASSGTC